MNKITTLATALLISLTTFAQNSPGKRPSLLLDKLVIVQPLQKTVLAYQKGYDSFYADENLLERYAENKNKKTDHDALANRVLRVKAVEPFPLQGAPDYKIVLQDTLSKETIFYKFNELAANKGNYYFEVVGGLNYPPDFYCDYIQQDKDALIAMLTEGISVKKIVVAKTVKYIMEVRTIEETISMVPGITLVMENGLQIVKPDVHAEVSASSNDKLIYIASFALTPHEVSLLGQSRIVSGKISKFDKTYREGEKLKQMVKCMGRK